MNRKGLLFILLLSSPMAYLQAWTPGTGSPTAADGLSVNTANRRDTLAFYQAMYKASENYAANMAWTGNVSTGVAGDTSTVFKEDVRRRINFYRALVGLPGDIVFNATKSAKDQKAALMFSRNNNISHTPPTTWTYYTADAADAAASSNITLGLYGPPAVDGFIKDPGAGNEPTGHRRWFLYSRSQEMGTGDIPPNGSYAASNSTWVIGNPKAAPTPAFVKWPNAGYHPVSLIPARWSLSYPGAGFGSATVTMTQNSTNVSVSVISRTQTGVGDNTIVWEPAGLPSSVAADTNYTVTVSGITGGGPTSHTYTVTLFDPETLGESVTITGSATPPASTSIYQFNSIEQADNYQLLVAKTSPVTWTEGAEDLTSAFISSSISAGYTLRQTTYKRNGSKAFQLTFPNSSSLGDQSFTISRDIVPSATSALQFYQLSRSTTANCTLSAQISTDGGGSWTSVWSRTGSSGNETTYQASPAISLASYAGKVIRVRFLQHYVSGSVNIGTNIGFIVDDITISNASEITSQKVTSLAASATSFTLDSTTAGAALVAGTTYQLAIRPSVGLNWFSYGTLKSVVAQTPIGYDAWVANTYPTVTGGQSGDHDKDGLSNAIEYAFGLNPTANNPSSALPTPTISGSNYSVTFSTPTGVTGVIYGAQWSPDLSTWNDITDTGSGSTHIFSVGTTGKTKLFFRHKPVLTP